MSEENWVDKAEEERLGIIAKYDKGREEGAEIEPWDDPAFEIYHVTDHYGFIHDQRFPLKFNPVESRQRELEAERADKWIKMNSNWGKYYNSEKLRSRTFKGIPNKVRGLFWGRFLDLETIKEQQKGKYEEMHELARKYSLDIRQIDLDVNRTYRDNVMFRQRYGVKQQSLFNILSAYSVYNSEVGYCQGMSQIAALLLTYMDEEDAFWGLSQLMSNSKYGMHGFFIAGFPKLVRFQGHHDKMLKAMMPKLKKHFDKHSIDVGLYTLKWYFQCFLDRVPFELAMRLWDVFLMDGDKALICGAYTILKIHGRQLLARKNMDDLLDYLQSKIPSDLNIDNDKAIQTYQRCSEELHRKKLDTAGEPGEDELAKLPFGLVEHIIKTHAVKNEKPMEVVRKRKREKVDHISGDESDEGKAKATAIPAANSSAANSPKHVSRPLSSVSNFSYASAIEDYNSSNKSTPLKLNGINSNPIKSRSTGYGDYKVDIPHESELHQIETGSVDSIELVENQVVINVKDSARTIFFKEGQSPQSSSDTRSRQLSQDHKTKPPPPPLRSLDADQKSPSRVPAVCHTESSHNNGQHDKSIIEGRLSSNIPGGVKIHVPYSNSFSPSPQDVSHTPAKPTSPRNTLGSLKNDPNRIKIDISSSINLI